MPNRIGRENNYRFAYQGQFAEKDQETGFTQFEARLFDSRIGRWMCPDPAGQYHSPYLGMGNSPLMGVDPNGEWFGKARAWVSAKIHGGFVDQDNLGNYYANWINSEGPVSKNFGLSGLNGGIAKNSGQFMGWQEINGNISAIYSDVISAKQTDWVDDWSESDNILGKASYNIVNDAKISVESLVSGPNTTHLTGEVVSGNKRVEAFRNTTTEVLLATEMASFKVIKNGVYSTRWGLRLQAHTHRIAPLKGTADGMVRAFHINFNKSHIILDPTKWKYFYKLPKLK